MTTRPVIAIDLGSTKVACAIGQPKSFTASSLTWTAGSQAFDLLGCGLASYPSPRATGLGEIATMAQTIEEALKVAGVVQPLERVVVTLTHPALAHTRVVAQIDIADEPVTIRLRELQRLKRQAISQTLGLDRDVLLLEPLGYTGNGFENVNDPHGLVATRLKGTFQLVTIPQAIRQAVTQALEAVGLDVEQLSYSLKILASASWSFGEATAQDGALAQKRFVLLDLGGFCTDLALVEGGRLIRTRSIPIGGMTVAEAIAKDCRLTMDQALPMSLEGFASQKPTVRRLVEQTLRPLQRSLHELLTNEVQPELVLVTGRGAMIDGFVEWVETLTQITSVLGRHPQTKPLRDLGQQLALSQAMGLLEHACQRPAIQPASRSGRLLNRLITRTKHILVEYF